MQIVVTGSIATDLLMTFSGRFADEVVADRLEKLSLSFLADDLDVRRGGVAANISFGLGSLGLRPVLVGAVGDDFADYRAWLEAHGVDTASVLTSSTRHTARFVCTTDAAQNQIATFYAGAMSEAGRIELAPVAARIGGVDLVVVSPNDPAAMLRHTDECRRLRYPFVADPSQQLASLDGEQVRALVDGAAYLFTNEYESAMVESKSGWDGEEVLRRVGMRVTTLGAQGALIERRGAAAVRVPAMEPERVADPTGGGDAFRAGFLAGMSWGMPPERAARVGAGLATLALEVTGTQEYEVVAELFVERLEKAYGDGIGGEVEGHLARRSRATPGRP